MFQSLRNQFLIPLSLAMLLIGSIVACLAYWIAASSAKLAIETRLQAVATIACEASFPLTGSVLEQMRDLSSMEIAILRSDGQRIVATNGLEQLRELDVQSIASKAVNSETDFTSDKLFITHYRLISDTRFDIALRRLQPKQSIDDERWLAVFSPHSAQQQLRQQAAILPIITGAVATLVIGFVATFLASRLRHRIEILRAHVGRLAKGSLDLLPAPKTSDEIARLTEDINLMTKQLHELQSFLSANQRATLINQFASGMAHQLRNTLTGARLSVQVYQRTHDQESAEDLRVAIDQLKLAEQTIQSLLQVRTGIDERPTESIIVAEMLDSIRSLVKNRAEHKKIEFQVDLDKSVEKRRVPDGQIVLGALLNLVLNALEAAPEGGQVSCKATLANPHVSRDASESKASTAALCQFSIVDNGLGPANSIADTMLEPFVTTKPEGIGLGLPMAKRTSQRLGGDLVWKRIGDQTEFILTIPLMTD